MKILIITSLLLTLTSCAASLDVASIMAEYDFEDDSVENLINFQNDLKGKQIGLDFYLMENSEDFVRIMYLQRNSSKIYFLDAKCNSSDNDLDSFSKFDAPMKINVEGVVLKENIRPIQALILKGLNRQSLNYLLDQEKLEEITVGGVLKFNMKDCKASKAKF
ncbi:MAG: hypothetical protein ACJ0BB_01245 [Dehalococcoidia bacterium]